MDNNKSDFYGILMGFNKYDDPANFPELKYAEKDAEDLYNVLINPEYGNYPQENFTLLQGVATTDRIQRALNVNIVKNRQKSDTVLVYYSGHGFIAGDLKDTYLGTPEGTITHLLDNPLAGLQIKYLQDLFLESPAGNVIFIIDCCHSGAFLLNPYKSKEDIFQRPLVDERNYRAEGRIAFVSSPRGVLSRESSDHQNGIFTYYLLEGLKGNAIESFSGEVTMESLIAYVEAKTPHDQQPRHYGHSKRLVLTSPKESSFRHLSKNKLSSSPIDSINLAEQKGILALASPLDQHLSVIDSLLSNLTDQLADIDVSQRILEAVRKTVNAELAFVVRVEQDFHISDKFNNNTRESVKRKEEIIKEISPFLFANKDEILKSRFGVLKSITGIKGLGKNIIAIPLWIEYPREFLLLFGMDKKNIQYGYILGSALKSLYESTKGFNTIKIAKIGDIILDGLRENFGYMPQTIYDRRFETFNSELNKIRFYFEPIVNLGKKNPQIDSWEALARDPETKRAPFSLFRAAELWGPGFIKALDIYCLQTAVREYLRVWKNERGDQKKDQVSVNVYPDTLFSEEYKHALKKIIIDEDLLKPKELVLEVSERRSIAKSVYEKVTNDPIELLVKKISEYSGLFGVAFAIDDFGVGYSSIERLVRLELDHVKIDREVLHQRHPQITINYVLNLVKAMHSGQTNVIVEGVDGFTSISLFELNELGIGFVQGHLIRRAGPDVNVLSDEIKELLLKQINTKPKKVDSKDNFIVDNSGSETN